MFLSMELSTSFVVMDTELFTNTGISKSCPKLDLSKSVGQIGTTPWWEYVLIRLSQFPQNVIFEVSGCFFLVPCLF